MTLGSYIGRIAKQQGVKGKPCKAKTTAQGYVPGTFVKSIEHLSASVSVCKFVTVDKTKSMHDQGPG